MTTGLLLAAGGGSRMGQPKALVHDDDGTSWLVRSVAVLRDGGCSDVVVVLGAAAREAEELVPEGCRVVVADDWARGMAASLAAGLASLGPDDGDLAVVSLVDLPDVSADVVRRLLGAGAGPSSLARAVYAGRPGHPVLMGRDHWGPAASSVTGDEGAKGYLREHGCVPVECGDLATGHDVDRRPTRDQHAPD